MGERKEGENAIMRLTGIGDARIKEKKKCGMRREGLRAFEEGAIEESRIVRDWERTEISRRTGDSRSSNVGQWRKKNSLVKFLYWG